MHLLFLLLYVAIQTPATGLQFLPPLLWRKNKVSR